jgi:ubiquinone/menaquinone biosynthesis C-methylase UbiE
LIRFSMRLKSGRAVGYSTSALGQDIWARRRGAVLIGPDFSVEMIAIAKQWYPELQFQEGDAESLPFPSGFFDAVVMNFGMHHLDRPERAAVEAARVLCSGGKLAFTVWPAPSESIGHRIILSAIETYGTLHLPLSQRAVHVPLQRSR